MQTENKNEANRRKLTAIDRWRTLIDMNRLELDKDVVCCFEQIPEAATNTTTAV